MTDEERKAFQYYKECNEKDLENYEYLGDVSKKQAKYLELLLDLIKKQSKEIEELKKPKYIINCETNEITTLTNDFISKDKIKAKIEEVDIQLQKLKDGLTGRKTNFVNKNMLFAQKKVLQSLLEKE